MMSVPRRTVNLLLFFFTVLIFGGCKTIVQEYVMIAADVPSRFTILRNKEGEVYGEYRNPLIPAAVISGDIEDTREGGLRFYVTEVRFFTNWPNGWTEGVYEASGTYLLHNTGGNTRLEVEEEFTLWDITSGGIRYFDTYYRGDEGSRKVKNRIDRMTEISRFVKKEKGFPGKDRVTFSRNIRAFLFPEAAVMGAGIVWDKQYTEKILPEQYIELRNSGTIYRDFEEAPVLFYTMYNLDYVMNTYLQGG